MFYRVQVARLTPAQMTMLYPHIRLKLLPAMLGYAGLGALLAGLYGIMHDQITYSISSEYFARLKFSQFQYANFGLPPRFFVAEIGFLATWWVGFFAVWFLARLIVPTFPPNLAFRYISRGTLIILAFALASSITGYLIGGLPTLSSSDSGWRELASVLGVTDLRSFMRVAYIHNASYLGSLFGLIAAIVYLRRVKARNKPQVDRSQPSRENCS